MNDEHRQMVIDTLRRGEELPANGRRESLSAGEARVRAGV